MSPKGHELESRILNWVVTAFIGVMPVILGYGVSVADKMSSKMDMLAFNVAELNQKMAVVIEKTTNQDSRISRLEELKEQKKWD